MTTDVCGQRLRHEEALGGAIGMCASVMEDRMRRGQKKRRKARGIL